MKLNWNFLGDGGTKPKTFCLGRYGYFLELHIGNSRELGGGGGGGGKFSEGKNFLRKHMKVKLWISRVAGGHREDESHVNK